MYVYHYSAMVNAQAYDGLVLAKKRILTQEDLHAAKESIARSLFPEGKRPEYAYVTLFSLSFLHEVMN